MATFWSAIESHGIGNILIKCAEKLDNKKSLSASSFREYGNLTLPRAEWLAEPEQYGVASADQIHAHLRQLELRHRISVHVLHKDNNLVHPTQNMLCYCCILQSHPCHQCIVVSFPESA